ncbi:MAG: hypothetical protein ABIO70_03450 [Pseudomonadota bacterium]
MIRVVRGEEPEELAEVRERRLEAARCAVEAGEAPVVEGYQVAKAPLWRAQHMKCCYCEARRGCKHDDVEHYRPKRQYWWLTWTWENLLFACPSCNRSGKGGAFPLQPGSMVLRAGEQPPGGELPVLIDPAAEDPEEHIEFRLVCDHWLPVARSGSRRGAETILLLGLDRMELRDQYDAHAKQVMKMLERTRPEEREAQIADLTGPGSPFTALTRAVLAR